MAVRNGGAKGYGQAAANCQKNSGHLSTFVDNLVANTKSKLSKTEVVFFTVTEAFDFLLGPPGNLDRFTATMGHHRYPTFADWLNLCRCVLSALWDLYAVSCAPGTLSLSSFRFKRFDASNATLPLPRSIHDTGWLCKLYLGSAIKVLGKAGKPTNPGKRLGRNGQRRF